MIDKFIKGNKYRVIHDSESKFNDGDIVVALENDDNMSYCALYTSDFDISKHGINDRSAYLLKIDEVEDKPMSIQEFENNAKKYFGNKDCLKRECKTCIFSNSDKPSCCFHTLDFIESEKRLRKWLKDDDKIKVGDMVKIVDDELIYSTYIDRVIEMIDELDIPEEIKKTMLDKICI